MSQHYEDVKDKLLANPKTWLVTGVAGFIGSNLLEALLKLEQNVVGIDNFSTGFQYNLDEVKEEVSPQLWNNFNFIEGDVCSYEDCETVLKGVDYVLHQAGLGSVPRSIENPMATNATNVSGHLNMLHAAMEAKVESFTYAASSSTYGDHPGLPKVEDRIGNPLSPYAVSKYVNELYGSVFAKTYGFKTIGLRYFNVFGKRQTPDGAYAAVIPKWTASLISGDTIYINGDGETSRDFCFIENTIQMNILAATAQDEAKDNIYNVAVGDRTCLNDLFVSIRNALGNNGIEVASVEPIYRDFRPGDVLHSQADISKAKQALCYDPEYRIQQGIEKAMPWYIRFLK